MLVDYSEEEWAGVLADGYLPEDNALADVETLFVSKGKLRQPTGTETIDSRFLRVYAAALDDQRARSEPHFPERYLHLARPDNEKLPSWLLGPLRSEYAAESLSTKRDRYRLLLVVGLAASPAHLVSQVRAAIDETHFGLKDRYIAAAAWRNQAELLLQAHLEPFVVPAAAASEYLRTIGYAVDDDVA